MLLLNWYSNLKHAFLWLKVYRGDKLIFSRTIRFKLRVFLKYSELKLKLNDKVSTQKIFTEARKEIREKSRDLDRSLSRGSSATKFQVVSALHRKLAADVHREKDKLMDFNPNRYSITDRAPSTDNLLLFLLVRPSYNSTSTFWISTLKIHPRDLLVFWNLSLWIGLQINFHEISVNRLNNFRNVLNLFSIVFY